MREYQTLLHFLAKICLCIVLIFPITVSKGYGQDKKRTYANFQGAFERGTGLLAPILIGSIDNITNAIDGNIKTFSTLKVPIGALNLVETTQFLEFTVNGQHSTVRALPAHTPVRIKFSLPHEVLGLLSSVTIGTFTELKKIDKNWPLLSLGNGNNAGYNSTKRTQYYGGSSLLNLLNGAGEFEITLNPTSNYNGVYLSLSSALSLELSADLYHAYILEDAVLPCNEKDKAIDLLTGVRAGTVVGGIANATGSVTNPWNAVDGDPNTYTLINTGAQILSEVYHTTIFQTPSRPNQVAKIVLQKDEGGVLDVALINKFVIQTYLGSTTVGSPLSSSTLLSLRLLPGESDIYELIVPVSGSFDRIEIKMGGVADALSSLRIYEVSRLPELPIVEGGSIAEGSDKNICKGDSAILSASAPNGSTIRWYTQEYGGSNVGEGTQFTTPVLDADTTYYVSSAPDGCHTESPRIPIHILVHPKPGAPHLILSNTQ